jgi:hypothetical protein
MTTQPLHDPEARTGNLAPSEQPLTRLNWRQAGISIAAAVAVAGGVTWLVSTGRAGGAVVGNSDSIARNSGAIEKLECLPERLARVEVQLEQQAKSLERIELAVGSSRRKVD